MSRPNYRDSTARPEAGTFAPKQIGPMAETARHVGVIVTSRPGGIHALLCRLGLHAWQYRAERVDQRFHWLRRRCAVCGVHRG